VRHRAVGPRLVVAALTLAGSSAVSGCLRTRNVLVVESAGESVGRIPRTLSTPAGKRPASLAAGDYLSWHRRYATIQFISCRLVENEASLAADLSTETSAYVTYS
jgi:hypothetical protein